MRSDTTQPGVQYPVTQQGATVDEYHGTRVADPYRWLEDDVRGSRVVEDWVEAQNLVTDAWLASIPQREAIQKRLTALWNHEKISVPLNVAGRYFFFRNDGLQNQSALYVQETLDGPATLLLDPNRWSTDGTVALTNVAISDDASLVAYGVADAGSDWNTWKVLDVATGATADDEVAWVKFSDVSWADDNQGFYYSRFPAPTQDAEFRHLNVNMTLYYHAIGTPQSADQLVYEQPDHPEWTVNGVVSEDGSFLIILVGDGTTSRKVRVTYRRLNGALGPAVDLISTHDHTFAFLGNDGSVLYFLTDYEAPKYQVVAVDTTKPQPEHWRTVIPEAKDVLEQVTLVGDCFICVYLRDARTAVTVRTAQGTVVREVALPGIGTAGGFDGRRSNTETFYSFSSFATPTSIYRYDLATGASTLVRRARVDFNPAEYDVRQVFYASPDGTRVPMFLAHRNGIELDGSNPTLLYGYGGFNISLTPRFSVGWLQWMEMGGVLAVANLRGGGEYGDGWHRLGTRLQKQNVFDDFIGAAAYLVTTSHTRPDRLAIQGGSNGGLLVGACLTQRPDLFGACLPAVGVMDMLRFHKFTAGRFWVDDYGSSEDEAEFEELYRYSPYHALLRHDRRAYPATLVTTADTDDRVVPGHSFKFVAALQAKQSAASPVLVRIDRKAGHGAGKPTSKAIQEISDQWAFLVKALRFDPAIPI